MSPMHRCAPALLALALTAPAGATDPADPDPQAALEVAAASHDAPVELETVVVSGSREALAESQPGATAGVTGTRLRERLFVNTEDALRNLPDLSIRKRYVGDRNALIGGRSHGTLQAPRGVVYADGVLLSNFLGRFNAPRWNMVAPEEIARVDVLYGPFSALYPGNSIGTTVLITTRDPGEASVSARAQAFTQHYEDYGYADDYGGRQYSVFGGSRWNGWSGTLGVNRLENRSQPMQYATAVRCVPDPAATPPKTCPQGTEVSGAIADLDPRGSPRLILGPDGGALEDGEQDQAKGRLAYESALLRADAQLGWWRNDYARHGASLLRDAAGNTVTRGAIRFQDQVYTVADSAFGPQEGMEEHLLYALTARSKRERGWNFSTVASLYDIADDALRSSAPTGSNARNGTITDGSSGKGWWNLDLQASYRDDGLPHVLSFGYYRSRYDLAQQRYAADDWQHGARGTLLESSEGSTLGQALYLQDVWTIAGDLSATVGLRAERWEAYGGLRRARTLDAQTQQVQLVSLPYAEREEQALSPKFSLAYAPAGWSLRYSFGRGTRFPTVSELFQGSVGTTLVNGTPVNTIVNNDPDLRPEDSIAQDLSWQTALGIHRLRVSLFRDDITDSIFQQTNLSVTPSVTNIQNVDRVVTDGIELVWGAQELLPGFDVDANLALSRSRIRRNPKLPASEGKHWPRVPGVRANLVANWRFLPGWNANLAARHSGRQYNELDNSDTRDDVFGAASAFTTLDARIGYHLHQRIEAGVGVENLTDEQYYIFHPYPGRSYLIELRASL